MAEHTNEPKRKAEQKKGITKHALGNYNGTIGAQNFRSKYPRYHCNTTEKWHIKFQKSSVKE